MYLVVGLGNPGREYEKTRHNMGFLTIDYLAYKLDIDVARDFKKALIGEGRINDTKIVLAKPQTYMNLSGISVSELMNWYKCAPDELIVIYDDIDLPVGNIRIRERGSAGSHNGMRSVIYHLEIDDFLRVRIGIGKPENDRDLVSHVLSVPDDEEFKLLIDSVKNAADAVELIIKGDIQKAQELYNKKPKKQKTEANEENREEKNEEQASAADTSQ
ncbi:MAG TPA: aminoacyl-tRNA hydrolase [Clostridiales bacterium]|jgi:PTH1 family peptidyl-tRNA hydrolase|nr:aminoacyl-tRNA hydrolase [Clostridiales bacterium]